MRQVSPSSLASGPSHGLPRGNSGSLLQDHLATFSLTQIQFCPLLSSWQLPEPLILCSLCQCSRDRPSQAQLLGPSWVRGWPRLGPLRPPCFSSSNSSWQRSSGSRPPWHLQARLTSHRMLSLSPPGPPHGAARGFKTPQSKTSHSKTLKVSLHEQERTKSGTEKRGEDLASKSVY